MVKTLGFFFENKLKLWLVVATSLLKHMYQFVQPLTITQYN